MLGLEAGDHRGFVSKPVKAIRKDQQGGRPKAYKDPASLGMGFGFGIIAQGEIPDGD